MENLSENNKDTSKNNTSNDNSNNNTTNNSNNYTDTEEFVISDDEVKLPPLKRPKLYRH